MNYKIIRQHRKTIRISILNNEIIAAVPKYADSAVIENAVESFKKKYSEAIINIENLKSMNYLYIYGEKISIENLPVSKINNNSIKKLFESNYKKDIIDRINQLAEKLQVNYKNLTFRKFKARWGSLDSKGHLKFNIYIFMLKSELIDYLIIHELSHIKYFNHSKDFWHYVSLTLPNYKALRKELKANNYLISSFF